MRRLIAVLAVGAGLALTLAAPAQARVSWFEGSFDEAAALAEKEGKLVLLDCWARWCTYCFEMDEKVWASADLASAIEREVVPVKAEVDAQRNVGLELEARFDIEGLPHVLVVDPKTDRVLERLQGYRTAEEIIEAVDAAVAEIAEETELAADPSNAENLLRLAARQVRAGETDRARPTLEKVLALDPECSQDAMDDASLLLAETVEGPEGWEAAREILVTATDYCVRASETEQVWDRLVALETTHAPARAERLLELRARRFPDDGRAWIELAEWLVERQENFDLARRAAERAAELLPESTRPTAARARLAMAERRFDDARALVAEAIEMDPHDRSLRELRLRIELAARGS